MANDSRNLRDRLYSRLIELRAKRSAWMDRWRDVSDFISPYCGRFETHDHLESRNYDLILDNQAERSLNVLVSGLANGATSPAYKWFKLAIKDQNNAYDISNAKWCAKVESVINDTFHKSNTYNSLHTLYRELCLFGVGVDLVMPDEDAVIRHHVLSAGEYCLATDSRGVVNTLYREFQLTAAQAVDQFGYDSLSSAIKTSYDAGNFDHYFTFCHAIEPRELRNESSKLAKEMPYASYYFQVDGDGNGILRESGFKYFPALCPRWSVLAGEAYGISPAIVSLPNIKQLQVETKAKSDILENLANPAVQAPAASRQEPISLTPGAINYTSSTGVEQQIRVLNPVVGDINAITHDISLLKQDIKSDFFEDLFLMIQSQQTDRKTATEIYALKEEKMLVLGAVVERLQHELLAPLVNLTFQHLAEVGAIPPFPSMSVNNVELEFQSTLALSQRANDITGVTRLLQTVQAISASKPEILDRLNVDALFDFLLDRGGVDPSIALSQEEANEIRQQRAEAAQRQEQMEALSNGASSLNQVMQAQKAGADASLATNQLQPNEGI